MSPKNQRDPETGLPIISAPNGKRFALETIGKALGMVLGAALLGLAVFIATGRAYTIISLPPRVEALEATVYAPHPMPQEEIDKLAAALWAARPSPPPARKGR